MSYQTETPSTGHLNSTGNTHEAIANNNAHLGATSGRDNNNTHLGSSTARDGETLSAGSTANGASNRMTDHNNALEKDFSRQNGQVITPVV
jgi:hypothetical protein